jgi:hypothetical protein
MKTHGLVWGLIGFAAAVAAGAALAVVRARLCTQAEKGATPAEPESAPRTLHRVA